MKRVLPDISFTVAVFLLVLCMAAQAATPDNEGKEVLISTSISNALYIFLHITSIHSISNWWKNVHLCI